jgi:hypothetical protein
METRIATKSGVFTGTTASTVTYQEVCRYDARGYGFQGKSYIQIRNTGAAQTLHYKIDGYLADPTGALGGTALALKAETSIATSTTVLLTTEVVLPYAAVIISVKGNSGNTTYAVEYLTY